MRAVRRARAGAAALGGASLVGCSGGAERLAGLFRFQQHPLWLNLTVFAVTGAVVWFAGTRLARYVNAISERTGLGKAFLGALLLGGITSLPEVATTISAATAGAPALAVNNVFGSIAMNVLLLAIVADVLDGGRALTAQVRKPTLILQGALSVMVIAVAAAAVMLSDLAVLGVGVGSAVVFVVAVVAFYLTHRFQDIHRWEPVGPEGTPQGSRSRNPGGSDLGGSVRRLERALDEQRERDHRMGAHRHRSRAYQRRAEAHRELVRAFEALAEAEEERARGAAERREEEEGGAAEGPEVREAKREEQEVKQLSLRRLVSYTAAAALAILVAGYFLSRTGSAIADQTGLGESLVGFILVALATSLPEISTMISAIRLGQFSLMFSEIFGTNIFNSTIIFYTDLAYRRGPLLEQVGLFSQVAALLGIVLTSVYIAGLVTRSNDTSVLRLGKDSLAVIALYAAGVVVLYMLR